MDISNSSIDIEVKYFNNVGRVKAQVTGTVVLVPELSTGILMSVGLMGLLGVGRRIRKEQRIKKIWGIISSILFSN